MTEPIKKWQFHWDGRDLYMTTPWLIFAIGSDLVRMMNFHVFLGIQPRWGKGITRHGILQYAILAEVSIGHRGCGVLPYRQTMNGEHLRWVFPYIWRFEANPWPVEVAA